jgi:hypothetical protein
VWDSYIAQSPFSHYGGPGSILHQVLGDSWWTGWQCSSASSHSLNCSLCSIPITQGSTVSTIERTKQTQVSAMHSSAYRKLSVHQGQATLGNCGGLRHNAQRLTAQLLHLPDVRLLSVRILRAYVQNVSRFLSFILYFGTSRPIGLWDVEDPTLSRQSAHSGYLSSSSTHFCQRLSEPPGPSAAGRIK